MELNQYTLDELNALLALVSLGNISYLQDNENAPNTLADFWKDEIKDAIKDATFEYGKLPY